MFKAYKTIVRKTIRKLISWLPQKNRFSIVRSFADCNPNPSSKLEFKIAETKEELEACYAVLHDAYVDSGFMKPSASGLRVTLYHALPTTTTLCAKYDGQVIGTISLIRESELGVPLQSIFDLTDVRAKGGNIAEVSALAIHRKFRRTGGSVLFPLMKFMYEYCTKFFDIRHLVIAVNPSHIEMYEALLLFKRLSENTVANYDFVNGAPAIGATLDLLYAPAEFKKYYADKPARKNLYSYFVETKLSNIQFPNRPFYTTNDPVLTPELLDYFFNEKTNVFSDLSERHKKFIHSIYDLPQYHSVLPKRYLKDTYIPVRKHHRFTVKCPATIYVENNHVLSELVVDVVDVSKYGFKVISNHVLPLNQWFHIKVQLGCNNMSTLRVFSLREYYSDSEGTYSFRLSNIDRAWESFVNALYTSITYKEIS